MSNSSIWPIDRTQSGTTSSSQNGSGSHCNGRILRILQSYCITVASPSDFFVSYRENTLGSLRCSRSILQPCPSWLGHIECSKKSWKLYYSNTGSWVWYCLCDSVYYWAKINIGGYLNKKFFLFFVFWGILSHSLSLSLYIYIYIYIYRTCQKRWTIGRSGERGSGISVLVARQDDDKDIFICVCVYI